jgi:hypothetical protein
VESSSGEAMKREASTTRPRHFLLLVIFATTAATPDLGKAALPAASIPDFSGVWDHPGLPGSTKTSGKPAVEWVEALCAKTLFKYGTEADAHVPTADKPDF